MVWNIVDKSKQITSICFSLFKFLYCLWDLKLDDLDSCTFCFVYLTLKPFNLAHDE